MLNIVTLGLHCLRKEAFRHKNNHRLRTNKEKLKGRDLDIPLTEKSIKIKKEDQNEKK